MSFRRDKTKPLRWQKWLQMHRDELIACGVPQLVLEEKENWTYFLEHGYFTPVGSSQPIINVDRLNIPDAKRLCAFLENDDFHPNSDALNRLQFLLKRGPHATGFSSTL